MLHQYFTRCASERERSERERSASSSVPFTIRIFCDFRVFFAIFRDFLRLFVHRDFRDFFRCVFAFFLRSRIAKNTGVQGLKLREIHVCRDKIS